MPVFPFGYDWRMPLDQTEEHLEAFVKEVIGRILLLNHYRSDTNYGKHPMVNLVGHSMGGLVIAGYVERYSGKQVDKVVTLGTPFQGSYEAVLKIVTGTSLLGFESGNARERRTARLTPALYHLLPSFGGLMVDNGMTPNLFQTDTWQPSVVRGIEAQVSGWDISGSDLFRTMLDRTRAHRNRISGLELSEPASRSSRSSQVGKDDWLAIVGIDTETRIALKVERNNKGEVQFLLRSDERRNSARDTGDEIVPLAGAIPLFLDESRLGVCRIGRTGVGEGEQGCWGRRNNNLGNKPSWGSAWRLIWDIIRAVNDSQRSIHRRRLSRA